MLKKQTVYVGTYTKKESHVNGKGKGIYLLKFDPNLPEITRDTVNNRKAFPAVNPSFLTVSPNKKYVFAVHETGPDEGPSGMVSAYEIDPVNQELFFINQQRTHGFSPCHISTDTSGKFAFVANYVGGILGVYPIFENGELDEASQIITLEGSSANPDRQESSHPHSINISPDNRFAFVPDLGTDKIMSYRLDLENRRMEPNDPPFVIVQPGAGPRHMDFHPNQKFAYTINELNNTVNVFSYNSQTGQLTEIQSITTIPNDWKEKNYGADIHVHSSGKFLYASNRGHNSIVIYHIDEAEGPTDRGYGIADHGQPPRFPELRERCDPPRCLRRYHRLHRPGRRQR